MPSRLGHDGQRSPCSMAAAESVPVVTPEQIVAREAVQSARVGLAALAAAVLAVIAGVLPQSIYADFPRVYLLDSPARRVAACRSGATVCAAQILFIDDPRSRCWWSRSAQGLSIALIGVLLVFLFDASVVRGANAGRMARISGSSARGQARSPRSCCRSP